MDICFSELGGGIGESFFSGTDAEGDGEVAAVDPEFLLLLHELSWLRTPINKGTTMIKTQAVFISRA